MNGHDVRSVGADPDAPSAAIGCSSSDSLDEETDRPIRRVVAHGRVTERRRDRCAEHIHLCGFVLGRLQSAWTPGAERH